jgi:hypothetical protein
VPVTLSSYQARKAQIRGRVASQLRSVWRGLPDYRDQSVDRFVQVAVPRVQAAQIAVARATAAYLGGPLLPRDEILASRKNIAPAIEYRRPAVKVYTELSNGTVLSQAVNAGANLLESLVSTDVQLASTHQAQASLQAGGYAYYVRVLSGSENCARCMIASTQRYHSGDLMPIHPGCDCSVSKVPSGFDPGQVIDPALLESTHDLVGGFTGFVDRGGRDPDYLSLIVTNDHGEYGPTLSWLNQNFEAPSDVHIVEDGTHK